MMRGIDEEKLGNSNKNRTSRCSIKEGRVGGSWGMDGGQLRASGVAIQHTQVNKQKSQFVHNVIHYSLSLQQWAFPSLTTA